MNNSIFINKKFEIIIAIIIILTLLLPFFSVPHPATITGQPWKVELLASLFLLLITSLLLFKSSEESFFSNFPKISLQLAIPLVLLIVWSGISYFWANSSRSVAHHTFVWINYFLVFFICLFYLHKYKSFLLFKYVFVGVSVVLLFLVAIDYLSVVDFVISQGRIRIRYARFAEMLIAIAPILWALALYSKKPFYQNLFLIGGICAWSVVIFSLSKGAFLAGINSFSLLFFALFFFSKTHFRRKILFFAGIWLVLTFGTQIYFSYSSNVRSTVQHISGEADQNRESSYMRIFTWNVGFQMFQENSLKGVGADNFGTEFNNSRRNFAKENPDNPLNSTAEDYFVERSHNEFLQILAELGIVGFLIFTSIFVLLFFQIFKFLFFYKAKFPPLFWGCLTGIIGFLLSSLVSSFSFRVAQNGIVFFIIFAMLVYELSKHESKNEKKSIEIFNLKNLQKPVLASICVLLLLSVMNFTTYSISDFNVYFAEREKNIENAENSYQKAIAFNSENASIFLSRGGKLYYEKRYKEAAENFRQVIELGYGVSVTYYFLAQCQSLSGDQDSAEKTMSEAVEYFPHSIYLRTHYGVLLDQNGKSSEAAKQFAFANKLNAKEARTWKLILEEDVLQASLEAEKDKNFIKPKNLKPNNVVSAVFFDNRRKASVSRK